MINLEYILWAVPISIVIYGFIKVLRENAVKDLKLNQMKSSLEKKEEDYKVLATELASEITKYEKALSEYATLLHQKKSSEVRLGKIGENVAPFLESWPFDSNNFRFIGSPIDGVSFNDSDITFVEIKTGKSRLSAGQNKIKEMIKEGKVKFMTFRIGEGGINGKIE